MTTRVSHLAQRLRHDRRGVAALEFAVAGSIFLIALFGVIEFGRYTMTQQALIESVHLATRYAVVHGANSTSPATSASLQTLVQGESSALVANLVAVSVTFNPNNTPGNTVTITATYPWSPIIPGLVNIPATTLSATATSTIIN